MEIIDNYTVERDIILTDSIIFCKDNNNCSTVLVRSSGGNASVFINKNILLKTNSEIIYKNSKKTIGNFHILKCVSNDLQINMQFNRVLKYIFDKNNETMDSDKILILFQDLQDLFETNLDINSQLSQIGIYGELIFLKRIYDLGVCNIDKLWHSNNSNKFDFEINSITRLEIKATTKEKRIHTFKHNQIFENEMRIYIASLLLQECDKGYSLYELMTDMIECFSDFRKRILIEKYMRRCGVNNLNVGIICNKEYIYHNLKIYDANSIPRLECVIPKGISSVIYDVDLENSDEISIDYFVNEVLGNNKNE